MRKWPAGLLAAALLFAGPALANDLSNSTWNTTDASNTSPSPNGWAAGTLPNQVEPIGRATMGAVKRWWERDNPTLSTTGSAGAYVLTPSNTAFPTLLTQGEVYCAKANFTSVGADTLNVNSLGAKPLYAITSSGLAASVAGTIVTGEQFCASYDGSLNSGGGGFQIISATYQPQSGFLKSSNNLSDVASAATSRSNLGIKNGGTATITGSTSGPSGSGLAVGDLWFKYQ